MRFRAKKPPVAFGLPNLLIELFYIGMPVVRRDGLSGGWSVGVRSRDLQDAGGHAISRQKNLELHLGCHTC